MYRFEGHTLRAARIVALAVTVVVATGASVLAQNSTDQQDSLRAAALLFRHSVISPFRRSIEQPNSSASRLLKCFRAAEIIACSRSCRSRSRSMFRSRAIESRMRRVSVFMGVLPASGH